MTDIAGRTLERKVDADANDHDARFALTMQRVRTKTGIVAFWYGKKKPHQSAVKVAIGFDVVDPVRPERVISHPETLGWVLAATSLEDLFEASSAQCGVRLLDLSNWRSIGVYGEAAAFMPKGELKPQASTVDAFGRPRDTRVPLMYDTDNPQAVRFARVATATPWDRIQAMNEDERFEHMPFCNPHYGSSLWDREVIARRGTVTVFPFFQNYRVFAEVAAGTKRWGLDTNLVGHGGNLPQGESMAVTGISLFLDVADPELRRTAVEIVGSTAYLDLRLGAAPGLIIPAHLALPKEEVNLGEVDDQDAVRLTGVAPAVYPLSQAIGLESLMSFGVNIVFPERPLRLDRLLEDRQCTGVGLKVVLHGPMFGPLAG